MSESSSEAPATVDPEPPEEFVKAAKAAPDHWLYLTDPAWKGEFPPPDWAVVGQWRSDSDGEIVEWQDNETYRPSPEAMGWPEPVDDVDRTMQLATTGYGPVEDVTTALARTEVGVLVTAAGEPVSATAPDGVAVVPVYTSPSYLQSVVRLGFEKVRVADLLDRIPEGHSLYLNSSGVVSMVLPVDGLAEVLAAALEAPADDVDATAPAQPRPVATQTAGGNVDDVFLPDDFFLPEDMPFTETGAETGTETAAETGAETGAQTETPSDSGDAASGEATGESR